MGLVLLAQDGALQHIDGAICHFAKGEAEGCVFRPFVAIADRAALLRIQKRRARIGERGVGKDVALFRMRHDIFAQIGKGMDEKERIPVHCRAQIVEIGRIAVGMGDIGDRPAAKFFFCGGYERRVVDERLKKERVVRHHIDGDDGNEAIFLQGIKFFFR